MLQCFNDTMLQFLNATML